MNYYDYHENIFFIITSKLSYNYEEYDKMKWFSRITFWFGDQKKISINFKIELPDSQLTPLKTLFDQVWVRPDFFINFEKW